MPAVRGGKNRAVIKGTVKRVRGSVLLFVVNRKRLVLATGAVPHPQSNDGGGPARQQAHANPMSHWHRHPRHGATTTPASSPHWLPGVLSIDARDSTRRAEGWETFRLPQRESQWRAPAADGRRARLDAHQRSRGHLQRTIITSGNAVARQKCQWARDRSSDTSCLGRKKAAPLARFTREFCPALGYASPLDRDMQSKRATGSRSLFTATRDASGGSQRPQCGSRLRKG